MNLNEVVREISAHRAGSFWLAGTGLLSWSPPGIPQDLEWCITHPCLGWRVWQGTGRKSAGKLFLPHKASRDYETWTGRPGGYSAYGEGRWKGEGHCGRRSRQAAAYIEDCSPSKDNLPIHLHPLPRQLMSIPTAHRVTANLSSITASPFPQ